MTPDPRLEWLRENIPGFKACNDQAVAARQDTEAYYQRLGHLLSQTPERTAHESR